jgi:hypothetical protein
MSVTGTPQKPKLTHEAREIIEALEINFGRRLTTQEITVSLDQARAVGELA